MLPLRVVLLILAFVSFVLAAINIPCRVNLTALGLALWVLTLMVM